MNHLPKKLQQNEDPEKSKFIRVKSRYLDTVKKSSSQTDLSGKSSQDFSVHHGASGNKRARAPLSSANSTFVGSTSYGSGITNSSSKSGKASKTSTPTKDVSLFAADVSVVPVHNVHDAKTRIQEDSDVLMKKVSDDAHKTLLLQTWGLIISEKYDEFAKAADNQLATLQAAVAESDATLFDMQGHFDVYSTLADIEEDLDVAEKVIDEIVDDEVFRHPEKVEDVIGELEKVLDELPCKNVLIPSEKDLDEIENAAAVLSDKLSGISMRHGEEMKVTAGIKKELTKINSNYNSITEAHSSIMKVLPVATTKVLDETAKNMMNSTLGTMEIKF